MVELSPKTTCRVPQGSPGSWVMVNEGKWTFSVNACEQSFGFGCCPEMNWQPKGHREGWMDDQWMHGWMMDGWEIMEG